MSLVEYRKKRDFEKTGEPEGRMQPGPENVYVIQKHNASHLHWDLRLELEGVLKSWALPKEPSTDPKVKRLAVQTEDHPREYADFSGTIPEGQYGAGTVEIWDRGTFSILESTPDKLVVEIDGKKLKGAYVLIRTSFQGSKNNWLFFRKKS